MKSSGLKWIFIVGVIVTIFIAFNYQGGKETIPLSEIFPESETYPVDIEYEFVDSQPVSEVPKLPKEKVNTVVSKEPVPAKAPAVPKLGEALKTEPEVQRTASAVVEGPVPFTIQVASFRDEAKANKELSVLLDKDYPAFVVSRSLGEAGTWYRVYVGKFESKDQASDYLTKVRKEYANSFIISPK